MRALGLAPYVIGLGIALVFRSWLGFIAGAGVFYIVAKAATQVKRRIKANAAYAAWGSSIKPGFTDAPTYKMATSPPPRVLYPGEPGDDGIGQREWLLADGAIIDDITGELDTSPDGRYLAARGEIDGTSFVIYDQVEHVRYWYDEPDAGDVFIRLFRAPIDSGFFTDAGSGPDSLAGILGRAERTPLFAWRGLWLPEEELPDIVDDVLTRELAPGLVLTAAVIGPADARTMESPYALAASPIRRIALNGVATPFLCEDLKQAMASDDGTTLIVKGCVLDEDLDPAAARWYFRGANGVWITLDDDIDRKWGMSGGRLCKVTALTPTAALFELDWSLPEDCDLYVLASTRALPFKVRGEIDSFGGRSTCRVPYQKFA